MERRHINVRFRLVRGCFGREYTVRGELAGTVDFRDEGPLRLLVLDEPLPDEFLRWTETNETVADPRQLFIRLRPPTSEIERRLAVIVEVFVREKGRRSAWRLGTERLKPLGEHACLTDAQVRACGEGPWRLHRRSSGGEAAVTAPPPVSDPTP